MRPQAGLAPGRPGIEQSPDRDRLRQRVCPSGADFEHDHPCTAGGSALRPPLTLALGLATSLCTGLLLTSLPSPSTAATRQPTFDPLTISRTTTVEPADAPTQARSLIIDTEPTCRNRTAQVLYDVGFRGGSLRTAWAIVMRESGGRPDAISATGDYGIFQINRRTYGNEPWWSDKAMLDREYNATAAFELTDGGRTFYPWDIDGERAHLGRYSSSGVYQAFVAWLSKFPCAELLTDTMKDPVVDSAGQVRSELAAPLWPKEQTAGETTA